MLVTSRWIKWCSDGIYNANWQKITSWQALLILGSGERGGVSGVPGPHRASHPGKRLASRQGMTRSVSMESLHGGQDLSWLWVC